MTTLHVDDHYVPTLGMQIVKACHLGITQYPGNSTAILVNEATAALLGGKDPLNQLLYRPWGDGFKTRGYHIVGVVKDFNYNSMHEKIHPVVLAVNGFGNNNWGNMAVRFGTNDVVGLLHQVEAKFS